MNNSGICTPVRMNNSFAFHFTLFVASHLFSQLFWQAASCVPLLHTPWLGWCVFVCPLPRYSSGPQPGSACWHLQPLRLSRTSVFLHSWVLSGLRLKPGLNSNPCYSLGRNEGVGSLRAQILEFLPYTKTFKSLMCLDPKQQTTLVVLCQGKLWWKWPARKRMASSKSGPREATSFSTAKQSHAG